eukprot:CAMPEP_0114116680 /NCGR_PEP_ID=MMETSP0043_2-20121206/4625_1 /TAXON_ID=464988 /ORGANISM="Hemiselmis andersenii, Strain CCMP644" /LENGTH=596 /DNA_ID=CAMNT_0001209013 /DNA_START=123 /DNA_END=1910 /DNA_ORIENTATION=+
MVAGETARGRSSAGIVVTDFRESARPTSARPSSARPVPSGGPTSILDATQAQRPVSARQQRIRPDQWGVRLDAEARASLKRKAADAARKKIGGVLSFAKPPPAVKEAEKLEERLERVLATTPRPLPPFEEAKIVLSQELRVPLWHPEQAPTPASLEAARQCAIHYGPTSLVKQDDSWRKIPPLPLHSITAPPKSGEEQAAEAGNDSEGEQGARHQPRLPPAKRRKSVVEEEFDLEIHLMEQIKHAAEHEPVMPTRRGSLAVSSEYRPSPVGAVKRNLQRPASGKPPTAQRPQTAPRAHTARPPNHPPASPPSASYAAAPATSRGVRPRDRRPLWQRVENALSAGREQKDPELADLVGVDETEKKWELKWRTIDKHDVDARKLERALAASKHLHSRPAKSYQPDEEEQIYSRARSIREQWRRDAKHREMMKGYKDKEEAERRRQQAAAQRAVERERAKAEEEQQRTVERKRHATRLCRLVLQALATDPRTGLAMDPKHVFQELDEDKSGTLDIGEFVQGLDAVNCKLGSDDLDILWEFLGGEEGREVAYAFVVEVLYKANEEALRGQRQSQEERLRALADASMDAVAASLKRSEASA